MSELYECDFVLRMVACGGELCAALAQGGYMHVGHAARCVESREMVAPQVVDELAVAKDTALAADGAFDGEDHIELGASGMRGLDERESRGDVAFVACRVLAAAQEPQAAEKRQGVVDRRGLQLRAPLPEPLGQFVHCEECARLFGKNGVEGHSFIGDSHLVFVEQLLEVVDGSVGSRFSGFAEFGAH